MSGKNRFKAVILLAILTLSLTISAVFVSAGTCISSDYQTCEASNFYEPYCGPSETYNSSSISQITECQLGCCCEITQYEGKAMPRGYCDYQAGLLSIDGDFQITDISDPDGAYCEQWCEGLVANTCQYPVCGGENTGECQCGSITTDDVNNYCCSFDNAFFSTQEECEASPSCNPDELFSVSGTVINSETTDPIIGASITVNARTVFSQDPNGAYTIDYLSGSVTLVAEATGYEAGTLNINVDSDKTNQVITLVSSNLEEDCVFTFGTDGQWDYDQDGCWAVYDQSCYENSDFQNEADRNLCDDNVDNDCDGAADCYDPDCATDPSCTTSTNQPYCGDGVVTNPNYYGQAEQCDVNNDCEGDGLRCDYTTCQCVSEAPAVCGDGTIQFGEQCEGYTGACNFDAGQTCDPVSCQCTSAIRNCGDGVLNGSEECEFYKRPSGSLDYNVLLENSYCSADQCIRPGQIGECLCRTPAQCGNGASSIATLGDGEECERGFEDICDQTVGDWASCNLATCKCDNCDLDSKMPRLSREEHVSSVDLNWSQECPNTPPNDVSYFIIKKCVVPIGSTSCTPTSVVENRPGNENDWPYTLTDEEVANNSKLCFGVSAFYQGEPFEYVSKNIACTQGAGAQCDETGYTYCEENSVKLCRYGVVETQEACSNLNPAQVCVNNLVGGNAGCVEQSECDQCNGMYGMFSAVGFSVWGRNIDNELFEQPCNNILTCYLDTTKTTVDKFQKCSDVTSCYDYNLESSCDDDKCNAGGCQWNTSLTFGDVGIGVCNPVDRSKRDCEMCEDRDSNNVFNNFFDECNKELCILYDNNCYFTDEGYNPSLETFFEKECRNKNDLSCESYINAQDCIGGTNFSINNLWDATDYVSGDNTILDDSNDDLGFEKCVWDGQKCFKDGNGNKKRDCGTDADLSSTCRKDFNPPTTILDLLEDDDGNIILRKDLNIGFSIIDKERLGGTLHYNLVRKITGTEQCNPTIKKPLFSDEFSGVVSNIIDVEGDYTFCYFGEDRSANFEVLREVDFFVDTSIPQVTYDYEVVATHESLNDEGIIEIVSDVNITVSVDETVTCTMYLVNDDSSTYNGSEFYGGLKTTKTGQNFGITYSYIEDGSYTFHANCSDSAGNQNDNQDFSFTLDADKTITNLAPHMDTFGPNDADSNGLLQINLIAETESNANCRYGTTDDDFNSMTKFTSTGGTTHTHTLTYNFNGASLDFPEGDGLKNYLIRCDFPEKGIYGSPGDYVRFAIDNTPPETYIANPLGEPTTFDDTRWWKTEEVENLHLRCEDTPIYYNNNPETRNFAGACEIYYALDTTPSNKNTDFTLIEGIVEGKQELFYYSVDEYGNIEGQTSKPIQIDNEEFSFRFIIQDPETALTVDTITWGKPYTVYIISSKSKKEVYYNLDFLELYYTIAGEEFLLSAEEDPQTVALQGVMMYRANLYIPQYDSRISNIRSTALGYFYVFAVDSHDVRSYEISEGQQFSIDITAPDAPRLDPAFSGQNNFENYYPDIFNEYNGKFYTNDQNLFVTGKSNDRGRAYYYLNDPTSYAGYYDMARNSAAEPIITIPQLIFPAPAGQNRIVFSGDFSNVFTGGRYVLITNNERTQYRHYRELYQISRSIRNGDSPIDYTTEVFLATPLESPVEQNTPVHLFELSKPYDWFGFSINLTPGWNTFLVKIRAAVGNTAQTEDYEIFLDTNPPEINNRFPRSGQITPFKNIALAIEVEELGAGLEESSIALEIDGSSKNFVLEKTNETTPLGMLYTYTIIYTPIGGFEDKVYNITFEAKDLAHNNIDDSYSFEIDSNAPQEPIFEFLDVDREEQRVSFEGQPTWFFNSIPDFTITYPDNAQVIIDSIRLYKVTYTGQSNTQHADTDEFVNCEKTAVRNNFTCTITNQEVVSQDGDYLIKISAHKNLTGALTSPSREHDEYFTIDNTLPVYTLDYDNITNSNENLKFTTRVEPGEKVLRAFIELQGEPRVELEPRDNGGDNLVYLYSKPFTFEWPVSDTESRKLSFTFYLRDIAGNEDSSQHSIIIDNEPPVIRIKEITTRPGHPEDNLNPFAFRPEELSPTIKEHGRFAVNNLEIIGEIVKDSNNNYDVTEIKITKRNKNGTIYNVNEDAKEVLRCGNINNIKDCYYQDEFIINFALKGEMGVDTPNYLLFEVEDEGNNVAYFTLFIVSDMTKPSDPLIEIRE